MSYAWTIIRDHIAEADVYDAVGIVGPYNASLTHREIIKHPWRRYFRMYDEDELCYEGFLVSDEEKLNDFGPLDDFGRPGVGCTSIQYFKSEKCFGVLG